MSYRRTGFDSRRVIPSLVTPSIHLTLLDDVDVTSTSTSAAAAAAAAAAVTDRWRDGEIQVVGDRKSWSVTTTSSPRRGSFLYRAISSSAVSHDSETPSPTSLAGLSRNSSFTAASDATSQSPQLSQQPSDDVIVTPFAQILHSLRSVRHNYLTITGLPSDRCQRSSMSLSSSASVHLPDDRRQRLAVETLDELEWCLDQLDTVQTHRSVSDMATSKFKRLLNRELIQFAESSKAGTQISEYICSTFLDKQQYLYGALSSAPSTAAAAAATTTSQLSVNSHNDKPTTTKAQLTTASRDDAESLTWRQRQDPVEAMSRITVGASQSKSSSSSSSSSSSQLRHDSSVDRCKYGVETNDLSALEHCMADIDNWGMDMFKLSSLTNSRPLTAVAYTLFQRHQLLSVLKIPEQVLVNYLTLVEEHYHNDVPYHNSLHAADVTQTAHVLCSRPALREVLSQLETLSTLFGCVIHDVDHPGFTNTYLINTGSELALMYNDESVLESHHLAVAFKLLQNPHSDILANLSRQSRLMLRRMTIEIVLATDMNKHMDLLANLKTMVETRKISGTAMLTLDTYSERIQVLQDMVHCADLSNPTKPLHLYQQWTERIMAEFFRQGDLEREQGLDISPMCDRQTATIEKTQVGFIDYIVHPLWETWAELVYPDCDDVISIMEYNRDWYNNSIPFSPHDVAHSTSHTAAENCSSPTDKFNFEASSSCS